jgi:hypothetical protein
MAINRIDPEGCDCHSCLMGIDSVSLNLARWQDIRAMHLGIIANNTGATFTVRTSTVVTVNSPGDDGLRWEYTSS